MGNLRSCPNDKTPVLFRVLSEYRDWIERRSRATVDGDWAGGKHKFPSVLLRRSFGKCFKVHVVKDIDSEAGDQHGMDWLSDPFDE